MGPAIARALRCERATDCDDRCVEPLRKRPPSMREGRVECTLKRSCWVAYVSPPPAVPTEQGLPRAASFSYAGLQGAGTAIADASYRAFWLVGWVAPILIPAPVAGTNWTKRPPWSTPCAVAEMVRCVPRSGSPHRRAHSRVLSLFTSSPQSVARL